MKVGIYITGILQVAVISMFSLAFCICLHNGEYLRAGVYTFLCIASSVFAYALIRMADSAITTTAPPAWWDGVHEMD